MRWLLPVGVAAVLLVASVLPMPAQGPTQPPPLFIIGQTYMVVVDCFPEWLTQGQPLNPCFAETLKVQLVRPDGWVVMVDPRTSELWTINPTRVYAVQMQPPAQVAGR